MASFFSVAVWKVENCSVEFKNAVIRPSLKEVSLSLIAEERYISITVIGTHWMVAKWCCIGPGITVDRWQFRFQTITGTHSRNNCEQVVQTLLHPSTKQYTRQKVIGDNDLWLRTVGPVVEYCTGIVLHSRSCLFLQTAVSPTKLSPDPIPCPWTYVSFLSRFFDKFRSIFCSPEEVPVL